VEGRNHQYRFIPTSRVSLFETRTVGYYNTGVAVTIYPDYRILVVSALFNSVYGYDEELGERNSDSRIRLLKHCQRVLADVPSSKVASWQVFRKRHPQHIWAHLYYALTCSQSDLSANAVAHTEVPLELHETFDGLTGFDQILQEFAGAVRMRELFDELKPDWERVIAGYDRVRIETDIARVHRFLKLSGTEIPRLDIAILPAPFESHFVAYAAPFRHTFYTIDGPGSVGSGFNIHEYLHLFVNAIRPDQVPSGVREVFVQQVGNPGIADDYNDPESFLFENTVRATHYAVGEGDPREILDAIRSDHSMGLTLVGPLYDEIHHFPESDEPSFARFVRSVWDTLQ
jgi:hypothetical protein